MAERTMQEQVLLAAYSKREATIRLWTVIFGAAVLVTGALGFAMLLPAPIERVENVVRVDTVRLVSLDTVFVGVPASDAAADAIAFKGVTCEMPDGTTRRWLNAFIRPDIRDGRDGRADLWIMPFGPEYPRGFLGTQSRAEGARRWEKDHALAHLIGDGISCWAEK